MICIIINLLEKNYFQDLKNKFKNYTGWIKPSYTLTKITDLIDCPWNAQQRCAHHGVPN